MIAHGWANKARDMHPMASGIIGEAHRLDAVGGRKRTRDLLVVTVVSCNSTRARKLTSQDQRNHGSRRRIKDDFAFNRDPRKL
jgi:hypothetical protein